MTTEHTNANLYTKDFSFLYSRGRHQWLQKQLENMSSPMTFGLLFCLNLPLPIIIEIQFNFKYLSGLGFDICIEMSL